MHLKKSDINQSLKIALIVGTLLNIINQGDLILNMMIDKINFVKLTLTYFVPFFVSIYTARNIHRKTKKCK